MRKKQTEIIHENCKRKNPKQTNNHEIELKLNKINK